MNRRVWCGSLATTATLVGFVTAQTPPAAAPAGSSAAAGPVYVMKTAGQPERRVQVVKSEKLPDGTFLTDVKDLATGVVYTLTNPAVLGTPAATTPAPKLTTVAATTGTLPPANTYVPPAATTATPRPLFGSYPNQPQQTTAAVTTPTPNATAPFSSPPRPIFGSFPNQQQQPAQTPGLRTTAGEKLVPAESVQPGANPQGLPQARTRKTDPLLAGMASTPAAMTARTPFVPGPNDPPSLLGKYLGAEQQPKDLPQPRVGTYPTPPVTANLGAPPTLLPPATTGVAFNPMVVPPVPKPIVVAKVSAPAPVPAPPPVPAPAPVPPPVVAGDLAIPSISPDAKPSAATGIFDSQPATPVQASVIIPPIEANAGPSRILPPIAETPPAATQAETTLPMVAAPAPMPAVVTPASAPAAVASPTPTPAPAVVLPVPAVTPAPIEIPLPKATPLPTPAAVPAPAVEFAPKLPAPPTGFPTPPINPAAAAVSAATPAVAIPIPTVAETVPTATALPADVLTMIDGLKNHRRPSFRMENATALAESQYAQHPDVLAALADVAKNDVAGVVRGHCINQLTTLGYSDATYLKSLVTWESDAEPAVRRAATAARVKLSGR